MIRTSRSPGARSPGPRQARGGLDDRRPDLGEGDVVEHPGVAFGHGARRFDLGGQVALLVALEDGHAAQLGLAGVDPLDPQDLGAAAQPGRGGLVARVVVAHAPGPQLPHRGRSGLVLDQELERADQNDDGQDRDGKPDLGHAAGINGGQLAVPRQLGKAQEAGEQGRHRDQLGQDVRQAQDHVQRKSPERSIARRDHLIAVGKELEEQHE